MKLNKTFLMAAFAAAILGLTSTLNAAIPWLHVDGNKIKDPNGNVVVLRGISLIDLGFLQDWQGGAINMINRLTNKSDPQGSSPGWYTKIIRIPIAPPDSVSGWPHPFNPNNTDLYNLLRTTVDYIASKDMYAIIDWHYVDNTYSHVASTSTFWEYMAPRFANDKHVFFELYNEPINTTFGSEAANWTSVKTDMQTWINIVRTYAPNNIILVAGPSWSQAIGPIASNPPTGSNLAVVSHIYPGHWSNPTWYRNHITTAAAVFPVMMTEWGFTSSGDSLLIGTITGYGQPLSNFREQYQIGNTAWVASYDWGPPMFYNDWTLRCGESEMGCFTKDLLYTLRNNDQPGEGDSTPPAAPTGLTATGGESQITLDWNNNSEPDLYGYNVYRSLTSGSGYVKLNGPLVTSSAYTDTSVDGYVTYYYVVRAVDFSMNESGNSNQASAAATDTTPPAAPTGLSATAGDNSIILNWNDNAEDDLDGYNVYRSTTSGNGYVKLNGPLVATSAYTDNTALNGVTYYYVVKAVDTSSNESANSSEVAAAPGPRNTIIILGSWTTGLTHAKQNGTERVLVFVIHVEDNDGAINPTSVTYGGQTMTKVIDITVGSPSRAYVAAYILNETGVAAATNGTFTINWGSNPPDTAGYSSAFFGNVNQFSLVGATASNSTNASTPNPITTSALTTESGEVVIDAATCGNSGSYTLNNGFFEGNDQSMASTATGVTGYKPATGANETPSATHTGPNRQVIIGFVLRAAILTLPPSAPTGLTASPALGKVLLDWNDNIEPDLAGYNVWRMPEGGYYDLANGSLVTSSNYTDTDVSAGTTYYYMVTALDNQSNESDVSNEVSSSPGVPAQGAGAILSEWWTNIVGTAVSDLTSDANYPDNPSGKELLVTLEGPLDWADYYGTRVRGYLNPITTGNYTFWIASDNDSQLWLSSDDNPSNVSLIASVTGFTPSRYWTKYPSQQSSLISLTGGQKYYIEVLHKDGDGGDNLAVAWQGPGIAQQIIDGLYLSPCCLDFENFADFAQQWQQAGCNSGNNYCYGFDFNRSGSVTLDDLMSFADAWLTVI